MRAAEMLRAVAAADDQTLMSSNTTSVARVDGHHCHLVVLLRAHESFIAGDQLSNGGGCVITKGWTKFIHPTLTLGYQVELGLIDTFVETERTIMLPGAFLAARESSGLLIWLQNAAVNTPLWRNIMDSDVKAIEVLFDSRYSVLFHDQNKSASLELRDWRRKLTKNPSVQTSGRPLVTLWMSIPALTAYMLPAFCLFPHCLPTGPDRSLFHLPLYVPPVGLLAKYQSGKECPDEEGRQDLKGARTGSLRFQRHGCKRQHANSSTTNTCFVMTHLGQHGRSEAKETIAHGGTISQWQKMLKERSKASTLHSGRSHVWYLQAPRALSSGDDEIVQTWTGHST
ncbi:hypothetical protein EV421DRAFT_1741847 [Armillaria borealis]|uniref:Uncharacterized protein n=1 Tax=Armillaria borealis TaxID=47425 RepID=A0AA39J0N8_9AGAR|nr:hypothetical protein EV421DRAFT_1741847 [Armillaria borealis]